MGAEAALGLPAALTARALAGEQLDADAIRTILQTSDILAIGALADDLRRARHGDRTTYVRVHEIDAASPGSWAAEVPTAAREIRIVGAPATIATAIDAVRAAHDVAGDRPVRGFALDALERLGAQAADYAQLAAAGLAEVAFVEATADPARIVVARAAGLAVRVVAVATPVHDAVAWLLAVRALQDAVGGVQAVAPLPQSFDPATPTTGFQDVRLVAAARIALETVPSIQVDWRRYGPKLAQVALTVGADDLDAVSPVDDLALGPRRTAIEEVRRNIAAAGLAPAERTGRFALAG